MNAPDFESLRAERNAAREQVTHSNTAPAVPAEDFS